MGEKMRLDRLCSSQLPDISRTDMKRLCMKGLVTVNGKPARRSDAKVDTEPQRLGIFCQWLCEIFKRQEGWAYHQGFFLEELSDVGLMVIQKRIKRSWSFSGLATMVRIMFLYYMNCYTFPRTKLQQGKIELS